ncbi:FAD-linked oxidoreductase [Mycobacterium vulneris]|jgi:FAD/FMN-containing dehydrogenase|uniref:FAD-linked oxidoreductase n=1 Tax=Mycolicibacterium vulneris TaxID=547163 RepID=A0A1X2L0V4_9MYCO|nr:FAD-binding oxidoreductase [Mycolicibacterium vulneris]OSC27611.1 FAD-linked oxidoreductase [Mycolicibacterium vulneris]
MTTNRSRPTSHEISRQTFLRGAVTLATGAVFGAAPAAADPAAGWGGLASSIGGSVLLPANGAQFSAGKQVFNSFYNHSNPAAVVRVSSQADVQQAVAFAKTNNLKIAPRGGGHSYVGASGANGTMVLDLRGLPGGANFDGNNVTVTPATNLYAVHQALAGAGRAVATGTCPTVGMAGLALGGGVGADARRAGLTCDALQSATVVLPTGDVVTASANDNPDLFWALRGGGGGNFGVTTSMTFATFATADSDLVRLDFPPSAAVQVLTGWQSWLAGADRNTWGMVDLSVGSAQANCHVLATSPAGTGSAVADALKSAVGLAPSTVTNKTLSHIDLVTYLAGGSGNSPARGFVAGSDVIGPMTSAAAHAIATAAGQWPASGAGQASVLIDPLGGAVADVAPGDTAFPWRTQSAVVQWYVEPAGNQVAAATTWLGGAHQAVQQFSVGGYVNYLEPNPTPARYYGPNLSRLTTVRQKYDPNRMMFSGLDF